ncbi:phage regulatory protein CII [Paucimonas lemoignei]|uniref:Phage regulatory protein CII n=1 Tax=Paucimonas lemoignei TaxID=29443 RepID=A0A4R3HRR4_PAULE|nr:phage regulatory CII family protein [Paucimonas lemoignei]TCS35817.1 phage regulatory protein CII [Paucimonas lemoignei]
MSSNRPLVPPKDVHEAFRAVVYDYGVPEMAAVLGMPVGTLYNKCNLNETTIHKPNLGESVLVSVVSGDHRIAEALSQTLGGLHLRLPKLEGVSDAALLEMVAEIHIRAGHFHFEIKEALKDGKFSREEHAEIKKKALQFITAVLETVKRIEGMVDE